MGGGYKGPHGYCTPSKGAPSPMPRPEKVHISALLHLTLPPMSKLEGAASPEDLALVLKRWPLPPPRISPLGSDDLAILPLEDMYTGMELCL